MNANWRKEREPRKKTRLMTSNVPSIFNKVPAIKQYLHTNRAHVAVITETHLQERGPETTKLKGYTLVSSCCRQQGRRKGGVAIFVHERAPYIEGEHRIASREHEMECCSASATESHQPRSTGDFGSLRAATEETFPVRANPKKGAQRISGATNCNDAYGGL